MSYKIKKLYWLVICGGILLFFFYALHIYKVPTFHEISHESCNPVPPSRLVNIFKKLPTLETERLTLRRLRAEDAQAFLAFRSDKEVARYLSWEIEPDEIDRMRSITSIMEIHGDQGEPIMWTLELTNSKKVIGYAGISQWEPRHSTGIITSILARDYWRQGYMRETFQAILPVIFNIMNLNKIKAEIDGENKASIGFYESFGFRKEAHFHQERYYHGGYHDILIYSLLSCEYKNGH